MVNNQGNNQIKWLYQLTIQFEWNSKIKDSWRSIMRKYVTIYRQDELKDGTLVGEDKFGNKYFENPRYFYGRNRWVEYSDNYNMNYDGSQVNFTFYEVYRKQLGFNKGWIAEDYLDVRNFFLEFLVLVAFIPELVP